MDGNGKVPKKRGFLGRPKNYKEEVFEDVQKSAVFSVVLILGEQQDESVKKKEKAVYNEQKAGERGDADTR